MVVIIGIVIVAQDSILFFSKSFYFLQNQGCVIADHFSLYRGYGFGHFQLEPV